MSPEDFAARMREIDKNNAFDNEGRHIEADALMVIVLRSLGYGDGCDVFEALGKWYA